MRTSAHEARLLPYEVMGGGAISAEDTRVGQGVWLLMEKKPASFTRKTEDKVQLEEAGDTAVYWITSPSGIGGATIWPWKRGRKQIAIRLRLRGLESFTVPQTRTPDAPRTPSAGDEVLSLKGQAFDANGKAVEGLPDQNGYFEVKLPEAWMVDNRNWLVLEWIDFFRTADQVVTVSDDASLRAALRAAAAGTTLRIAPGQYQPGIYVSNLAGSAEHPAVIEGADPADPPCFQGGTTAWHLSDCQHLTLRNLAIQGQSANGINIDDGGDYESPSHHIVLEGVQVSDVGPKGNRDGIKMSGVDDFLVRRCRVEGWGGQAIDMVGCHRGLIDECEFVGKEGYSQSSGPQTKGGSSQITIRDCRFQDAGSRAVNVGGSTGLRYSAHWVRSMKPGRLWSRGARLRAVTRPWRLWVLMGPWHATTRSIIPALGCCGSCRRRGSPDSWNAVTASSCTTWSSIAERISAAWSTWGMAPPRKHSALNITCGTARTSRTPAAPNCPPRRSTACTTETRRWRPKGSDPLAPQDPIGTDYGAAALPDEGSDGT